MSEVVEERLYGLVEIAERQQSVAQMALEGMASERIALGQEREQWIKGIGALNEEVRRFGERAVGWL